MGAAWLSLVVEVGPSSMDLTDEKGCKSTEFSRASVQHHSKMQWGGWHVFSTWFNLGYNLLLKDKVYGKQVARGASLISSPSRAV